MSTITLRAMTPEETLSLALDWARFGVPVLPVAISWAEEEGKTEKRPLNDHSHLEATTDEVEVQRQFGEAVARLHEGDALAVGLYPGGAGFAVLDPDVKGKRNGFVELANLEQEHSPLPDTYTVDTASGGAHHWFRKNGAQLGNEPLIPGAVDVRADKGWVVAPGVFTPWGAWQARAGTTTFADLPAWVVEVIGRGGAHGGGGSGVAWSGGEVYDGERSTVMTSLAGAWRDLGLSERGIYGYLYDFNEQWCVPPYPLDGPKSVSSIAHSVAKYEPKHSVSDLADLMRKAGEATGQTEIRPAVVQELDRIRNHEEARELLAEMRERQGDDRVTRLVWGAELLQRPDPTWMIEDVMPPTGVGHVYGPSYVGKSLLALNLCLSVANGVPTWQGFPVLLSGPAIYVAMEGGFDLKWRIQAWLTAHPGASLDHFAAVVEERVNLGSETSVQRLIEDVRRGGLPSARLIVVDTQGLATPGVDENSNTAMNQVLSNCHVLASELDCFVPLVHHTGWEGTHERGASSQRGGMDLRIAVDAGTLTVEKVKAGRAGVTRYFELEQPPGCRSVYARTIAGDSVLGELARRQGEVASRIRTYVAEHQPCSKSAVYEAVGGRKAEVWRVIDLMVADPHDPLVTQNGKLVVS